MPHILNYTQAQLQEYLSTIGEKPFRAKQIMQWIYHQNITDFDLMHTLPKTLRAKLKEHLVYSKPNVAQKQISSCGTIKWLLHFNDEKNNNIKNKTTQNNTTNCIETVYIPENDRGTLCISSQIGCALSCQFCATGLAGFYRNLTTAEIINQVYFANEEIKKTTNKKKPITNIVFMGMGEPLLNEKNVFGAANILLDDLGFGLSKYKVTISTSGIAPAMERMIKETPASLAVSIHAADNITRDKIVPINRKYPIKTLLSACDAYTQQTKRSITYEYVMLKGINDSQEHAKNLAKLLENRKAKVNLIPYNAIENLTLECASEKTIANFCQTLLKYKVRTTVRKTRGDDIDAACGQLLGDVATRKKTIAANKFLKNS